MAGRPGCHAGVCPNVGGWASVAATASVAPGREGPDRRCRCACGTRVGMVRTTPDPLTHHALGAGCPAEAPRVAQRQQHGVRTVGTVCGKRRLAWRAGCPYVHSASQVGREIGRAPGRDARDRTAPVHVGAGHSTHAVVPGVVSTRASQRASGPADAQVPRTLTDDGRPVEMCAAQLSERQTSQSSSVGFSCPAPSCPPRGRAGRRPRGRAGRSRQDRAG